ncbi:Pyrimidine-specific ribonucleoside hydrolase RihB [Durusdinium trenchii]|uniref:Pyrimidine-specific ribonucleoside hydrolase RihB n=1 Tax=Durusdinium trenchii TaxID=1381693 RepID=A0ABP0RIC8_9DINO
MCLNTLSDFQDPHVPEIKGLEEWKETKVTTHLELEFKREQRQTKRRDCVVRFLKRHDFSDVNKPRIKRFFSMPFTEKKGVYPLHVAAKLGDLQMVRFLLQAGADPERKTRRGLLASDFVVDDGEAEGDAAQILALLSGELKIRPLRSLLDVTNEDYDPSQTGSQILRW